MNDASLAAETPVRRLSFLHETRLILLARAMTDGFCRRHAVHLLGLSPEKTTRILLRLVREGRLVRTGDRRSTSYHLP